MDSALLGIVLLAAGLRFPTLSAQSYWLDEANVVHIVHDGLGHLFHRLSALEVNPPLYYLAAWAWAKPFGTGEFGLRALSALFGTATVPLVYLAGRELISRRTGLIAAALIAVSPIFVWYSQEARGYALLGFLVAAAFLFFVRALKEPRSRALAGWAVCSALAIATHYFAGFVVAVEAVWLILRLGRGPARRVVYLWVAVPGAAAVLLTPLALRQLGHTGGASPGGSISHVIRVPGQLLVGYGVSTLQVAVGVAVTLLLAYSLWLFARRGGESELRGARLAAFVSLCAFALAFALILAGPALVNAAHVLAFAIPLVIAIAAGLGSPHAERVGTIISVVVCGLLVAIVVEVASDPLLQRVDYRDAVAALGQPSASRAILLKVSGSSRAAFTLYARGTQPLPRGGVHVREIDLLALSSPLGSARHLASPKGPIPAPAAGFSESARRETSTYTLIRFRARKARLVTRAELRHRGLSASTKPIFQVATNTAR